MSEDLIVTSQKNLMKRNSASGSGAMSGPGTAFGSGFYAEHHIPHNVKDRNGNPIAPLFRVAYEPWGDGKVIMAVNDGDYEIAYPPNTYPFTVSGPACMAYVSTTELVIVLLFPTNIGTQEFPIHWVIYEDYGLDA